jgi:hypothetical protein
LVSKPVKSWHAGTQIWASPQPKTIAGIRIRWRTLTMRMEEKGCHASCAAGAMAATTENCSLLGLYLL